MLLNRMRPCFVPTKFFHASACLEARNIKPFPIGLEGQWRLARGRKVIKVELPDFEKMRDETKLTPEEYVSKLKEKGLAPPRKYNEKPIVTNCIQGVLDPYVPPEGDGKYSVLTKAGVSQKAERVRAGYRSTMAQRRIKTYEDDFDPPGFAQEALKIYIKVHELLATNKRDELLDYVTTYAYPLITFQTERKTIRWTFIKQLEIPYVSQTRTHNLIDKENVFAQVTVRLNTRQILAVYDRFGHLMHGNEAVVKDVLEYVVFEKNISDYHGRWRLHAKIIPDWLPKKDPILNTFVREDEPEPPTEEELMFLNDGIVSEEKEKKSEGEASEAKASSN